MTAPEGPPDLRRGPTRLRGARVTDAAPLFPLVHGVDEVTRWLCWDGPADLAELEQRYGSWWRGRAEEPVYVLVMEDDRGAAIGEVTLRFDGHPGVGDLGYWLGVGHQGAGHGGRAVALAVDFAFGHCGARALTASVKEGNAASLSLLRRLGFVLDPAPAALAHPPGCGAGPPIAWVATLTRRRWTPAAC